MRGRAGSFAEISVFPTGISEKQAGNFANEHFNPLTGMKPARIINSGGPASSCIACCTFRIISIPFNGSDTALRVTEAMMGEKVIFFVFHYVRFVSRIWRQNSSPGSLAFPHLGNRAEISHMKPRRNSSRI